jgi:drug/metabolite transporter (DMT)-like permease
MLRALLLERHLTHTQSAFYATFGYLMFSISDAIGKWLLSEGFERPTILVLNSLPSLIFLTLFMIKRHGIKNALRTRYTKLHILRGLALISITYFMFNAVNLLPLTDFYGVVFSTPFFVAIGAWIIFKEKSGFVEILAILIGFIGVLIVIQPDYNHFNIGYAFGLGAVLSVTAASLLVRRIGRDEDPYLFVIFGNIAIIAANIIPALNAPTPEFTLLHIAIFTLYAFTIPLAVLTMSAVFARAPTVAAVVPYQYLQILWGAILGYLLFNDIPKIDTLIGSAIVIACGLYILFHHKRQRST